VPLTVAAYEMLFGLAVVVTAATCVFVGSVRNSVRFDPVASQSSVMSI